MRKFLHSSEWLGYPALWTTAVPYTELVCSRVRQLPYHLKARPSAKAYASMSSFHFSTTEEQWHWTKARRLVCVCVSRANSLAISVKHKYCGLRADSHLEPGADSHLPRTTAVSSIKVHHGLHLLNTLLFHLVVSTLTGLCAPGCWEGGWPGLVIPGRPVEAMPCLPAGKLHSLR